MTLSLSETFDAISAFSSAISALATVGTLIAAWWIYKGTVHAGSKPVLIFSVKYGSKWQLQNVGNGPAIDPVVYELHDDDRLENVTRCHPLAAGGVVELSWLKVAGVLVAVYRDSHGNWFTSRCASSMHSISAGDNSPAAAHISHQWLQEILAEPDGSTLSEEDLYGKTWEELDILRNTPYAQHGQQFLSRPDLRAYFERQPWYKPLDVSYDAVARSLTKRETYEAHFILNYQVKHKLTRPRGSFISETKMNELSAPKQADQL